MAEFTPITFNTQEEFDKAVGDRLKRQERQIRSEYSDYDDLKEQSAKWQQEKEDLNGQIAEHQKTIKGMQVTSLKEKIARESGIPYELASRLSGETEDEIRKDAEAVGAFLKPKQHPAPGKSTEPAGKDNREEAKKAELTATLHKLRGED